MISSLVIVCITFTFISTGDADECTTENCTKFLEHYYELGCKPIIDNGKCCPTKWVLIKKFCLRPD